MLTPKQTVINSVLIAYIDYSITENYIGKIASFLPYTITPTKNVKGKKLVHYAQGTIS